MRPHRLEVERGIERQQARLIGLDTGPEKLQIRARENRRPTLIISPRWTRGTTRTIA